MNPLLQSRANPMLPPSAETLAHAREHNQFMNKMLIGLLGKQNLERKDVLNGLVEAVKNESLTPQQAAIEAGNLPEDPAEIHQYLKQHFLQNIEVGRRIQQLQEQRNAG